MEKAILKTLAYSDIFDYPLKVQEIHKWLIGPPAGRAGKKATLRQIEKVLESLSKKSKVKSQKGYFFLSETKKRGRIPHFLPKRSGLVIKRKRREKQSEKFLLKAKIITFFLKVIPWIKLVGISGGLAMDNADKKDDIDLFIITSKNRIWLTRLLTIGILDFLGVRRKVKMKPSHIAGKLCANILLEEDQLEQTNKDIFTAHEVLQMKVLWERDGVYGKYLEDNSWTFKFLPNWVGDRIKNNESRIKHKKHNSSFLLLYSILDFFENLAKKFQLKIMEKPQGMERIEDGALYFHPNDIRPQVLLFYKQRVKRLV